MAGRGLRNEGMGEPTCNLCIEVSLQHNLCWRHYQDLR